ncbi:MAG TPA: M14 family metallopeptidase [Gemmatimonadaceae bacterium]
MRRLTAILPALTFLVANAMSLEAQRGGGGGRGAGEGGPNRNVLVVPGERHGTSVFALTNYPEMKPLVPGQIDWQHYHTSAEIEEFMRKWAQQYPDLVDLYSVGKSFGGRDIWQMTLTNKRSGAHTDKPAAFFEGGRHSGEISGTESAFYLMWYLLENYAKDPAIKQLLDTKAIYIKPMNNPDGSDMYRLTAQSNRSSVRPQDNDGDGLLDEDAGEDIDGDGHIRQMRKFVGMGNGSAVVDSADPSGRLMRGVGQGRGDYVMYPEGFDNDGDGRFNEDGIGGLDLHRNYPANWRPEREATGRGWTQFGAGEYPTSEPETRAVVLWVLTHPNIGVANSMDTSVPMHLRGPSTCEQTECMFPSDLKFFQHFDSVGLSITRYPWAGDVYRTYATRGGRNPITGEEPEPQPLFGHGPDFGYFHVGAIWYGDEIWNGGRERDYNNDGRVDQYEVLRYCDEEFGGTCYQKWTKAVHPTLGEVEVGGYNPKFFSQNGPPKVLEKWARNQAMFNLYMAQSLPQVEIAEVAVAPVRAARDSATHEVRVTVRNAGRLPTALEMAKRVKIVRPDNLTIRAGQGSTTRIVGRAPEFWLAGGESKVVTLRVSAGSAETDRVFTVRASSTRGGIAMREVRLN